MNARQTSAPWTAAGALAGLLAAGPAGAEPVTYVFDPAHTFVHFEVLHFGTSTTRGRFGPVAGAVQIDRAAGRGELAIAVRTASVSTGIPPFDARLRAADLLASDAYPEATFVAQRFTFRGEVPSEVRGEFIWRGVSQPLSLHARLFACRIDAERGREVCGGEFEGELLRSEFGATFGLPFVADRVRLRVQVEAIRL